MDSGFSDLAFDRYFLQDQGNELVISRITMDLLLMVKYTDFGGENENIGKHVPTTINMTASPVHSS